VAEGTQEMQFKAGRDPVKSSRQPARAGPFA
jgi:hypothetical protein